MAGGRHNRIVDRIRSKLPRREWRNYCKALTEVLNRGLSLVKRSMREPPAEPELEKALDNVRKKLNDPDLLTTIDTSKIKGIGQLLTECMKDEDLHPDYVGPDFTCQWVCDIIYVTMPNDQTYPLPYWHWECHGMAAQDESLEDTQSVQEHP